jgi:hypothetical protein
LRRSISGASSRSVEQGDEALDFCERHKAAVITTVDRVSFAGHSGNLPTIARFACRCARLLGAALLVFVDAGNLRRKDRFGWPRKPNGFACEAAE